MKAFDPDYKLLDEMYQDKYYPDFLVDKVKDVWCYNRGGFRGYVWNCRGD